MDAWKSLTDADLASLAAALRSGRLHAPYTAVSVRRHCGPAQATAVAAWMQQLHDDGMKPEHLALLAETALRARGHVRQAADLVDLVWTGPETPGIANRDTGVVVRELFGSAEAEVLIAGFAVYQGQVVFKRLAERMEERPGLRVRLFLDVRRPPGDTSPPPEVLRRFADHFPTHEWPGTRLPELYFDPRSLSADSAQRSSLHAKCVVIDRRVALVTSANFTQAAQVRNIEVGALIRDAHFAARLVDHFVALADAGLLQRADAEPWTLNKRCDPSV